MSNTRETEIERVTYHFCFIRKGEHCRAGGMSNDNNSLTRRRGQTLVTVPVLQPQPLSSALGTVGVSRVQALLNNASQLLQVQQYGLIASQSAIPTVFPGVFPMYGTCNNLQREITNELQRRALNELGSRSTALMEAMPRPPAVGAVSVVDARVPQISHSPPPMNRLTAEITPEASLPSDLSSVAFESEEEMEDQDNCMRSLRTEYSQDMIHPSENTSTSSSAIAPTKFTTDEKLPAICEENISQHNSDDTKEVSSRVYCRWTNGNYYWGCITKKFKKKGSFHYSIKFDDGDELQDVQWNHVWTIKSYKKFFGRNPPQAPSEDDTVKDKSNCHHFDEKKKGEIIQQFEESPHRNVVKFVDDWNSNKKQAEADLLPYATFLDWIKNIDDDKSDLKTDQQKRARSDAKESSQNKRRRTIKHPLIGKQVCQKWTDVHGRNKIIYGITRSCEKVEDSTCDSEFRFSVEYNEDSRECASSPGANVPEYCQNLKEGLAWGALIEMNEDSVQPNKKLSGKCWKWITPDMRREELIDARNGRKLPRLTMTVRGYQLTFSIKKSTIPKSGYGVFVKATPLMRKSQQNKLPFELKPGELLDMGVYAPLCPEDKKEEPVFFVKNFIHSYVCEEWTFDADVKGEVFDITDDFTGDAHDVARSHIHAYVNECCSDEVPSVRAEHDPCGHVHYLLGIADNPKKSLVLPADGTDVEIFLNYGPLYEIVRLRKGYSRLPAKEKNKRLKELESEDEEYLRDIDGFCGESIADCVVFLQHILRKSGAVKKQVERRALLLLPLLSNRAKALLHSDEDVDKEGLKAITRSIGNLIRKLSKQNRF